MTVGEKRKWGDIRIGRKRKSREERERGAKGLRLNINTLLFGRHGREKVREVGMIHFLLSSLLTKDTFIPTCVFVT